MAGQPCSVCVAGDKHLMLPGPLKLGCILTLFG